MSSLGMHKEQKQFIWSPVSVPAIALGYATDNRTRDIPTPEGTETI